MRRCASTSRPAVPAGKRLERLGVRLFEQGRPPRPRRSGQPRLYARVEHILSMVDTVREITEIGSGLAGDDPVRNGRFFRSAASAGTHAGSFAPGRYLR